MPLSVFNGLSGSSWLRRRGSVKFSDIILGEDFDDSAAHAERNRVSFEHGQTTGAMSTTSRGRNELCSCGSGRKFKQCCGIAPSRQGAAQVAVRAASGGHFTDLQAPWRAGLRQALAGGPAQAAIDPQRGAEAAKLVDRGARLILEQQAASAVPLLRQAAQLDPSNPKTHLGLGLGCLNAGLLQEAVSAFRQAIALKPDYGTAHANLARAFDLLGLFGQAVASYQIALRFMPKSADMHSRLGELLAEQNRVAEAIANYQAAASCVPGTTLARLNEARILMLEQKFAAASELLRQTVSLDPTCAKAYELLGMIAYNSGRFDEAVTDFRRAIEIDPRQTISYLSLVNAKKITRDDAALLDRMRDMLKDTRLPDPDRILLNFALGKAMDDQREYAEAIQHFDAANRIRTPQIVFDRKHLSKRVDQIIATFNAESLVSRPELASADRRPIFIIGMPRSGTTLVEQILSSHPAVAAGGELPFWVQQGAAWEREDIDPLSLTHAARLTTEYSSILSSVSAEAARVTDKMPFNYFRAGLLSMLYPHAAIIHCQRHPVDVCLSIYTRQFQSPMVFGTDRSNLVFFYRQYERLMEHWRLVLPRDRFLEVPYDALVAEPELGARRLVEFCGLEWDDACLHPERNERVVRTASAWQVRQPINKSGLERWRRYEPWLGELRELLPSE